VWIVARPETIALAPVEKGTPGSHLIGKVSAATFLGAVLRLRVDVKPGLSILVDLQNPGAYPVYAEGDRAAVLFDPERVIILPRGGGTSEDERQGEA
jgi:hypothetical protein